MAFKVKFFFFYNFLNVYKNFSLWIEKDDKLARFYSQKIKSKRKLDASGAKNLWVIFCF